MFKSSSFPPPPLPLPPPSSPPPPLPSSPHPRNGLLRVRPIVFVDVAVVVILIVLRSHLNPDHLTRELTLLFCFFAFLLYIIFRYDKLRSAAPVLRGLSFKVPLGTTTALVGPSGAGKSTVGGLLLRLYEPSSGSVRIDGVDLRHIDARWLRQTVAVVSQEPVLFGCSIFDNIAYGARARAAADAAADSLAGSAVERAHCSEFISGFAEGLQTMVGERGVRLSGGQKQRVAIARALLHDPPILLLDEATSALDAESEAAVSAALATLVAQRTTIVIAHRLSTIVGASQIVCLAQGAVVGAGTHTELLLNCPEYAALVRRQLHAASDNNLVGKGGPEMPGVGKLKPERVNI
ncbi:P-loop containing nucleoside triphosphate hydrolase protein [Pavlovales sp. CCMP2436]|nr:P-loop containing nucleoside triphosphate hydrolase protein [Pavlovales sp. CCMP2436]